MEAVVLHGISELKYQQVPVPELRPGTVRVQLGFCGVCGSDIPRSFLQGALTPFRRSAGMSLPARCLPWLAMSATTLWAIG